MCGDTMCPSCGPAQGYDPVYEKMYETLSDRIEALCEGFRLTEAQLDDLLEVICTKVDMYMTAIQRDDDEQFARQQEEEQRAYQEYMMDQYS
jgi:hypothetical protein